MNTTSNQFTTWWELACNIREDMTTNDIVSDFVPRHLWEQYMRVQNVQPNYYCFSLMRPEEIFMAMCFLSYMFDPKE